MSNSKTTQFPESLRDGAGQPREAGDPTGARQPGLVAEVLHAVLRQVRQLVHPQVPAPRLQVQANQARLGWQSRHVGLGIHFAKYFKTYFVFQMFAT